VVAKIFKRVSDFSSLVKISHTVFAMPFAVIGFFLAMKNLHAPFDLKSFLLMVLCMFFARNAAMSFNRIIDRHIDGKNPRTCDRDIPSGKIKVKQAYIFLFINILLFITTAFFLNFLCFILSPVALVVILGYSFTKRFTYLSHFVLGLGLSMAPIGAYMALTAQIDYLPLLYSGAVLFWVSGFDIIYSLSDISFDKKQGLHSIPEHFGINRALIISWILHMITLLLIIAAGVLCPNGILFWIGTLIFSVLLFYQHLIVSPGDLSRINRAFFTVNGFSGLVFLLFFMLDIFLQK